MPWSLPRRVFFNNNVNSKIDPAAAWTFSNLRRTAWNSPNQMASLTCTTPGILLGMCPKANKPLPGWSLRSLPPVPKCRKCQICLSCSNWISNWNRWLLQVVASYFCSTYQWKGGMKRIIIFHQNLTRNFSFQGFCRITKSRWSLMDWCLVARGERKKTIRW
jgi:hypothetical protein